MNFRVKLPDGTGIEVFDGLGDLVDDDYPHEEKMRRIESNFRVEGGKASPVQQWTEDQGVVGVVRKSADGLQVAQFRLDGLTYSRLKPYMNWEEFVTEALKLWRVYEKLACPEDVLRIGLRYINVLEIPTPILSVEDYVTIPLSVPPKLDVKVGGFLTRVLIQPSENDIRANLTYALERSVDPQKEVLILDIDAYRDKNCSPSDEEGLQLILEDLHALKNEIFFASITERTGELYS